MFQCEKPIGVIGLGMSHGHDALSNRELIARYGLNTTLTELENKTGIEQRYFLSADQSLSDMAAEAAAQALAHAQLDIQDLDRLIVATSTADYLSPSTACVVQHKLGGKDFPCYDVSAACSGFVFAFDQALRYLHTGDKRVMIIGADARSRTISTRNENTFGLYGDGAGALILGLVDSKDGGVMSAFTFADGSGYEAVSVASVGHAQQTSHTLGELQMPSGNRVMKNAIKAMPRLCQKVLDFHHLTLSDVGTFVFHQPNLMLLKSIAQRMGIPEQKVATSFPDFGNTVAGSIPITLYQAFKQKRLQQGELVLMAAIGAGFTSGATLMRWNLPNE